MKCPACHHDLQLVTAGVIEVDACVGHCGGVWFDNRELQQVDEAAEQAGEELTHIERDPALVVDMRSKRKCPVCPGITMMRHFFSVKKAIEVDECASCGGVWLDADELGRIRGEFETAAAREQAAEHMFDHQFAGQLHAMRQESQAKQEQADRFARVFKWACPSAYIPGKQEGGAF